MEKGNINLINSMIKDIESTNSDLAEYIKNLPFSSRNDVIKEILRDIIVQNDFIKGLGIPVENIYASSIKEQSLIQNVVDDITAKIKNTPSKKVIYIKEFLDWFEEISESDKKVILQSLKDEKIEELQQKMLSLVEMFDLKA